MILYHHGIWHRINLKFKMSGDENSKLVTESCTLEKVVSSVEELFEELELYGVPSIPEMKTEESDLSQNEVVVLLKALVNASYHMLYRHRKILREYEELEMKKMRDVDDNHALKATVERLKRELNEKDSALFKKEEEVHKIAENFSKTQRELKIQAEETRQLKCQLKYNEKKNAHEVRKKDQEINKLQLHLERTAGSRPTSRGRQPALAKEVKVAKRPAEKEESYQQIICRFESNNKTLMLENEIINRALHKLNSDLAMLVADYHSLLHFLPEGKENEDVESKIVSQMKEHEELLKSAQELSLEECIASSNKYVESLNTLVDTLKEKYI